MKDSLAALAGALLIAHASAALAASSVDLSVKGAITPSACTPSLPGAVDFGKISAKDLNADAQTRLPDQTIKLSVSCEGSTRFAITPFDNRTGSSTQNSAFGLGLINDTEKLGRYFLTMRNPVADVASTLLSTRGEGRWGELYDDDAVVPNALIALGSFDATNGWLPHPLQDMSVEVVLNTAIAPAKSLTLTNEVQLDGSATFEVKYL